MPGPALSKTFTYDGTPGKPTGPSFNHLDRVMIQTQRFFKSAQIGTHARTPYRSNIPQNSGGGIGVGSVTHVKESIDD